MKTLPFTVHRSPFSMRYLFAVFHGQWSIANGQCTVNSKWSMVNSSGGAL
jgi:hypothetical protein